MYRPRVELGTMIREKTGRVKIKIKKPDGKEGWQALARRIYENTYGELKEGYRVFLMDGNPDNFKPSNLSAIRFNTMRYVMLRHSEIYKPIIRVIDKRTGKVLVNS